MNRFFFALLVSFVGLSGRLAAFPEDKIDFRQSLLVLGLRVQANDPAVPEESARLLKELTGEKKDVVLMLVKALADRQDEVRLGTVAVLVATGRPAVTEALSSRDSRRCREVVRLLSRLGAAATPAVPALVALLEDEDESVRTEVTGTLGKIGPAARAALPALLRLRRARPVPALSNDTLSWAIRQIDNEEEKSKVFAREVTALVEQLKHKDEYKRHSAAYDLGSRGPAAAAAVPALIAALEDKESLVRGGAARALGRIGPPDRVLSSIKRLLKDSKSFARASAVEGIGELGPAGAAARPLLEEALTNADPSICMQAAESLWRVTGQAGKPVQILRSGLHDKHREVQEQAMKALLRMGAAAEDAVPPLIELLKSEDATLRQQAAEALGKIGPPAKAAVPELIRLLPDFWVRKDASVALGRIGAAAVPALTKALANRDANARSWAAEALREIGPEARTAIPALIKGLRDTEKVAIFGVRSSMARALGAIGPAAVPAVVEALQDEDPNVRECAAFAIRCAGRDGKAGVKALGVALSDPVDNVRLEAAHALVSMGEKTEEAILALRNLRESRDRVVRESADGLLRKIGKD